MKNDLENQTKQETPMRLEAGTLSRVGALYDPNMDEVSLKFQTREGHTYFAKPSDVEAVRDMREKTDFVYLTFPDKDRACTMSVHLDTVDSVLEAGENLRKTYGSDNENYSRNQGLYSQEVAVRGI